MIWRALCYNGDGAKGFCLCILLYKTENGSAFWQMYDNIIPLMLQNTFGLGETVTGALMAMDNVLALFLLPVFGTLSDKVETRLGKRTPFILAGTVLAVIFMLLLPVADNRQSLVPFLAALFATLPSTAPRRLRLCQT